MCGLLFAFSQTLILSHNARKSEYNQEMHHFHTINRPTHMAPWGCDKEQQQYWVRWHTEDNIAYDSGRLIDQMS